MSTDPHIDEEDAKPDADEVRALSMTEKRQKRLEFARKRMLDPGTDPPLFPRGLMILPPQHADPELVRPYFARLRELATRPAAAGLLPASPDLSMGMSGDFEVAVEEGATLVRVGTRLFGRRRPLRDG